MSGTSLDGADAALVDFAAESPRTIAFATVPYSTGLRERVLALCAPGQDSVDLAARVAMELASVYSQCVHAVLAAGGAAPERVAAIGCHGQTIRHRPAHGYTVQLNDPARLAELTGIEVVADFRSRDMASGGQGAPLVPAFHESVFRHPTRGRAIVNIGGISNVTWLPPGGRTLGFDCGPGNVLLDGWAARHLGMPFDKDGTWAASGTPRPALLERLLSEPFLALPPPKSTGRELFHMDWLDDHLPDAIDAADVQSTLAEFTARAIVGAIDRFCTSVDEIYLAGGGARNPELVRRITALAKGRAVAPTDALGVPTGHVESMAFAWLAMKCVRREPIDLTAITGARAPRILGAIYPA